MFDGAAFGKEMTAIVKAHVERVVSPLLARIDSLEKQVANLPQPKEVDAEAIVTLAVKAIAPEIAGMRADIDAVSEKAESIASLNVPEIIAETVKAVPAPEIKGVSIEEARQIAVNEMAGLRKLVEAIPSAPVLPDIGKMVDEAVAARIPEDMDERIEIAARKAFDEMEWPADGIGLTGALIDKAGHLVLTLSNGEVKDVGPVCGKDADPTEVDYLNERVEKLSAYVPAALDGYRKDHLREDIEKHLATKAASVTREDVSAMIQDAFEHLAATKEDVPVTVEDFRPMIEAEVTKRVGDLPAAKDGDPGKDADPELIKTMVQAAVDALPPAANGKDADPEVMREMIVEAVAALPPAQHGKDADPAIIKQMVDEVVSALPPAKDGKDCDMQAVEAKLSDAIYNAEGRLSDAIAAIPVPKDGKSVTAADIEPLINDAVQKAVDAIPRPKDGKDGIGLAGAMQNKDGDLIVTLTSGELVNVGRVMGWDGADVDMESIRQRIDKMFAEWPKPKDGLDGLGFDDLDITYDGEKTFTFKLSKGERVKEFTFVMPVVVDKGVFKEGQAYLPGDGVTWGGSFWICQTETKEKPDSGKDWRLSVKRGKDGKDADPNAPKKPGPVKL